VAWILGYVVEASLDMMSGLVFNEIECTIETLAGDVLDT